MRTLLVATVFLFVAGLAGCGADETDGPIPFISLSAPGGWSPTLPRDASTPAEIAQAIASRAGFGEPITARVFHTPLGLGLTTRVPFGGWHRGWHPFRGEEGPPVVHYAEWRASLVDGVIQEVFAKRGIRLNGDRMTNIGVLPNGTTVLLGEDGLAMRKRGNFFHASDAAIKHRLTAILSEAQLTPVSIAVLRVGQPAPAVVVKTDKQDPTELVPRSVMTDLFGAFEGYYIMVESSTGEPLGVCWQNGRTDEASRWFPDR